MQYLSKQVSFYLEKFLMKLHLQIREKMCTKNWAKKQKILFAIH